MSYILHLVCLRAPLAFASLCYTILQTYIFFTVWGINSLYLSTFSAAIFTEFSHGQNYGWLELPSNYDILQEMGDSRLRALWKLDIYLHGWSEDSHRDMPQRNYEAAMVRRVMLCFKFATFSTFHNWLDIVFIKLQPLMPWGILYDVYPGHLYGCDEVDYSTYIRRGTALFIQLLLGYPPLLTHEVDQLAEFLIFLASDLSSAAQSAEMYTLLADIAPSEALIASLE